MMVVQRPKADRTSQALTLVLDAHVKDYVTATKDLTVYWKSGEYLSPLLVADHPLRNCIQSADNRTPRTFEGNIELIGQFKGQLTTAEGQTDDRLVADGRVIARACITSCYGGEYFSATFRSKEKPIALRVLDNTPWYCCPDDKDCDVLLETREIVSALWHSLGIAEATDGTPSRHEGLVVFSGGTNSAKSSIAQAFALDAIRRALPRDNSDRLPHLVTFEDPIEPWIIAEIRHPKSSKCIDRPDDAAKYNFCLTARAKKRDVTNLRQALQDARRQTPCCFYIGEIRRWQDWEHVLEFAGTGHLVVATTHAASLSETIDRIFRAVKATTPAKRREAGGQLWACAHLKLEPIVLSADESGTGKDVRKSIVLPAAWTRKGAALNSLVCEGLSSVVPNGEFVFSRMQFLEQHVLEGLFKKESDQPKWESVPPLKKIALAKAIERALELDTRELSQL